MRVEEGAQTLALDERLDGEVDLVDVEGGARRRPRTRRAARRAADPRPRRWTGRTATSASSRGRRRRAGRRRDTPGRARSETGCWPAPAPRRGRRPAPSPRTGRRRASPARPAGSTSTPGAARPGASPPASARLASPARASPSRSVTKTQTGQAPISPPKRRRLAIRQARRRRLGGAPDAGDEDGVHRRSDILRAHDGARVASGGIATPGAPRSRRAGRRAVTPATPSEPAPAHPRDRRGEQLLQHREVETRQPLDVEQDFPVLCGPSLASRSS